jgi:hypothetical protein
MLTLNISSQKDLLIAILGEGLPVCDQSANLVNDLSSWTVLKQLLLAQSHAQPFACYSRSTKDAEERIHNFPGDNCVLEHTVWEKWPAHKGQKKFRNYI